MLAHIKYSHKQILMNTLTRETIMQIDFPIIPKMICCAEMKSAHSSVTESREKVIDSERVFG